MSTWGIILAVIFSFVFLLIVYVAFNGTKMFKKKKWYFYQGLDSSQNDIGQYPGTLAEIKKKCLSEPTCKGFNDNGWIKHKIRPIDEWSHWTDNPEQGFRLKITGEEGETYPTGGVIEYD